MASTRIPPILLLLLATAFCAWQRASGLAPAALFVDDQWLGLACRELGPLALRDLHLPAPLGFTWLQQAMLWLFGARDSALQVVPFGCGLAQVPLFYVLVLRLTGNRWVALAGALLAAGNPITAEYSVRGKQYVLEQVATTGLLILALREPVAGPPTCRMLAACLLASLFSLGALLVALALLHSPLALLRAAALRVAAFDLAVLGWWLLELRHGASPGLHAFWQAHYLGGLDTASLLRFAWSSLVAFPGQAFALPWLALLVPAAVAALLCRGRPEERRLAAAAVVLFLGMVAAAALHLVPIGTGRTELFAYPLLWVPVCAVLARARRTVLWAVLVLLTALLSGAPRVRYPQVFDRQGAELCAQLLAPGDVLVLGGQGALCLGWYRVLPVALTQDEAAGHHFRAVPRRKDCFAADDDGLARAFTGARERVLYFTSHNDAAEDARVAACARDRGFTVVLRRSLGARVGLIRFVRAAAAPR